MNVRIIVSDKGGVDKEEYGLRMKVIPREGETMNMFGRTAIVRGVTYEVRSRMLNDMTPKVSTIVYAQWM